MYIVIAAHGHLADALVESARMITGYQGDDLFALNMTFDKGMDTLVSEASEILGRDPDGEYLVLADLFGASPFNSCLSAFRSSNYRLITGVNVPIVLEAILTKDDADLGTLWNTLAEVGAESVRKVHMVA